MKITLVGTLPPIKGISAYCIEQAGNLSKKIEVEFIGFKSIYPEFLYPGGTKEYNPEFKIASNKNLEIRNILSWYNPLSWLRAGLTFKGELLHINWWTFYLFPILLTIIFCAKIRNKKIITSVHNIVNHESGRIGIIFSRVIYKLSDHLIVHSNENRKTLISQFGVSKNKISQIPLGTLTVYSHKKITRQRARNYFNFKRNQKIILYFGTIRKYKGLAILLQSFKLVLDVFPSAKLLIAGKNWINWKPYQSLIDKLNLRNHIISHLNYIPTPEIKYYFMAADLVIYPYLSFESSSASALIALNFHKPVVVTRVGGLPQVVSDHKVIAAPNDFVDLSYKINYALKNLKKLAADAEHLSKLFSGEKIALRTQALYRGLLK